MTSPVYVGSRSTEILAMLEQIESRHGHAGTYLAGPAAGADSPVAVDARRVAAAQLGEGAMTERLDVDAVEHIRQDRLRRWHGQP